MRRDLNTRAKMSLATAWTVQS